ncbi:MAG: CRISPR-associated endonuclease Cas3'' [Thiothrix litoralis]|uniref:CRISPR-associated endonuclease Cas3'' n=1 Tax=Thiothrix litoralis TaxID=2891210 RepID=UPI003C71CBCE
MPTSSLLSNAAAHLVELAGLFHDFGKANQAFQDKLKSTAKKPKKQGDPLRHEYVSWWMLEQLVNKTSISRVEKCSSTEAFTRTHHKITQQLVVQLQDETTKRQAALLEPPPERPSEMHIHSHKTLVMLDGRGKAVVLP